jgi:hypothetical protein
MPPGPRAIESSLYKLGRSRVLTWRAKRARIASDSYVDPSEGRLTCPPMTGQAER